MTKEYKINIYQLDELIRLMSITKRRNFVNKEIIKNKKFNL